MPVTNAYTESINRLAKDKNREGRGYSFEVMRARMLYTTKHKKKAPDREGLSVLQENHRLRTAGLRRGTQLRGRSINHLIMVSGWWGKGAPSTIKSVYPLFFYRSASCVFKRFS
nr:hypothetical protein [Escherichia coli]